VSGQLHVPAALPPRIGPQYPLDRRLGGPQSWSRRRGEENILALPGLELRPLGRPARSHCIPQNTSLKTCSRNTNPRAFLFVILMKRRDQFSARTLLHSTSPFPFHRVSRIFSRKICVDKDFLIPVALSQNPDLSSA
jgi:hypothetical protein